MAKAIFKLSTHVDFSYPFLKTIQYLKIKIISIPKSNQGLNLHISMFVNHISIVYISIHVSINIFIHISIVYIVYISIVQAFYTKRSISGIVKIFFANRKF